jgi:hypothetical protein
MQTAAARFFFMLLALPGFAAELEVRYGAIERMIAEQLFTQDGRHYMRGGRSTKCQFAYLEAPHIDNDGGRLRIAARFSGRTALDLFSRCVGVGDSFDLVLTAAPIVRNGAIALKDLHISTMRDSYYIRRVRTALLRSFSRDFKIEIRDQARHLLEQTRDGSPYKQELADFDLGEVHVTPEALVLVVEFRLVVK